MSFKNLNISTKLPAIMLILAVLNAGIIGYVSLTSAQKSAEDLNKEKLSAIQDSVLSSLDTFFQTLSNDLIIQSQNELTKAAITELSAAFKAIPAADKTAYLQTKYIDENPNAAGKKQDLDKAPDGSDYSNIHAKYNDSFRTMVETNGYYDMFIFDADGNVVYTVFKERDYATNMVDGKWKDTDLGLMFRAMKTTPVKNKLFYYDFRSYAPSNNVPATFIGVPVLDKDGKFMGGLAYQIPTERINKSTVINKKIGAEVAKS